VFIPDVVARLGLRREKRALPREEGAGGLFLNKTSRDVRRIPGISAPYALAIPDDL